MIEINFMNNYAKEYNRYYDIYLELASITLSQLNLNDDYEISVTLVDNNTIKKINTEYRFKNYATDVITFENEIIGYYEDSIDLGDVFISVDKAIEQANEYQHSIDRELSFLFVHGMLHTLGYDHQNIDDENKMISLQEVILNAYQSKK
ncbi:putative rRNA maturation factor [Bacilli bacterium PM5-3]|nr:putative rRNA maturation factor [Bacilli bacterium PM5-3]MDH6602887.1 putative rRNA maturation factor [Bacilli bacterium PM5-9]